MLNLVDEANELLGVTPTEPIDEKVEEDEDDEMSRGSLVSGGSQIALDATGDIAIGRNGLETDYRGDPNCPYGRSATANKREFVAVVLHHTAPDQDTNWYVQYQIDGDSARRGHFGYHFYISPDGRILQGAPLGKRTNQVKSPSDSVRYSFGSKASNRNSIGISCVGAALVSGSRTIGSRPTPQQTDAVYNLAFALCDLYSISFLDVYGHGEIQSNRHEEEGRDLAQVIRSWTHSDG